MVLCPACPKLAFICPEELRHLNFPVIDWALWKMSLKTGKLVYADHIVDPAVQPIAETELGEELSAQLAEHPDYESTETSVRPRIDRWSDLAIAIAGRTTFYAFTTCPNFGQKVERGQATTLSLEGDYWKPLLDCLAESEDGRTVSKGDLMIALRLLVPGELSEEAARSGDDLYDQVRVPGEKLRKTMSDLGRRSGP